MPVARGRNEKGWIVSRSSARTQDGLCERPTALTTAAPQIRGANKNRTIYYFLCPPRLTILKRSIQTTGAKNGQSETWGHRARLHPALVCRGYPLPSMAGRQLGRLVFAPRRLHARVHHRIGADVQADGRVCQTQREGDRLVCRPGG